jgi:hypothetical protein
MENVLGQTFRKLNQGVWVLGGAGALAVRVGCWRRELLGAIKVLEIWGCVYRDSLNGASVQLGKLLFMLRLGHALATALSC